MDSVGAGHFGCNKERGEPPALQLPSGKPHSGLARSALEHRPPTGPCRTASEQPLLRTVQPLAKGFSELLAPLLGTRCTMFASHAFDSSVHARAVAGTLVPACAISFPKFGHRLACRSALRLGINKPSNTPCPFSALCQNAPGSLVMPSWCGRDATGMALLRLSL